MSGFTGSCGLVTAYFALRLLPASAPVTHRQNHSWNHDRRRRGDHDDYFYAISLRIDYCVCNQSNSRVWSQRRGPWIRGLDPEPESEYLVETICVQAIYKSQNDLALRKGEREYEEA